MSGYRDEHRQCQRQDCRRTANDYSTLKRRFADGQGDKDRQEVSRLKAELKKEKEKNSTLIARNEALSEADELVQQFYASGQSFKQQIDTLTMENTKLKHSEASLLVVQEENAQLKSTLQTMQRENAQLKLQVDSGVSNSKVVHDLKLKNKSLEEKLAERDTRFSEFASKRQKVDKDPCPTCAQLEQRMKSLKQDCEDDVRKKVHEADECRRQAMEYRSQLDRLSRERISLRKEAEQGNASLSRELSRCRAECDTLKQQVNDAKMREKSIRSELDSSKVSLQELPDLRTESSNLKQRLNEAESKTRATLMSLQVSQSNYDVLKLQVEEIKSREQAAKADFEARILEYDKKMDCLMADLKKRGDEVNALKNNSSSSIKEMEAQLKAQTKAFESLELDLKKREDELEALQKDNDALQAQCNRLIGLDTQLKTKEHEIWELKLQIDVIRKESERKVQAAKDELASCKQSHAQKSKMVEAEIEAKNTQIARLMEEDGQNKARIRDLNQSSEFSKMQKHYKARIEALNAELAAQKQSQQSSDVGQPKILALQASIATMQTEHQVHLNAMQEHYEKLLESTKRGMQDTVNTLEATLEQTKAANLLKETKFDERMGEMEKLLERTKLEAQQNSATSKKISALQTDLEIANSCLQSRCEELTRTYNELKRKDEEIATLRRDVDQFRKDLAANQNKASQSLELQKMQELLSGVQEAYRLLLGENEQLKLHLAKVSKRIEMTNQVMVQALHLLPPGLEAAFYLETLPVPDGNPGPSEGAS